MVRETILAALFAQVTQAPAVFAFVADFTEGSAALANVSDASGLFAGLPLTDAGGCLAPNTVLQTVSPPTLSAPALAGGSAVAVGQGFRVDPPETSGRRLKWWDGLADLPQIFVRHVADVYPPRPSGIPAKVTVEAEIWIYSGAGDDPTAVPETALNYLVDAVEACLAPTPVFDGVSVQNVQTLGGLVEHCWIEGRIEYEPGDSIPIACAVIDVKMLVPQ